MLKEVAVVEVVRLVCPCAPASFQPYHSVIAQAAHTKETLMVPAFLRLRFTAPLWCVSFAVVLLVTTLAAFSTTRVLAVSYQLSGKVTDQAGTAVAGATVDVINLATSAPVGSTTTTASGRYARSVEAGTIGA